MSTPLETLMPKMVRTRHARPDVPGTTCSEAAALRARYLLTEEAATIAAMATLSRLLGRRDMFTVNLAQGIALPSLPAMEVHLEKEITG